MDYRYSMPMNDLKSQIWQLEGFWKSQDWSKYPENRSHITGILAEYDDFSIKQMMDLIDLEIMSSAHRIYILQLYQKNIRALKTIMEKTLHERVILRKYPAQVLQVSPSPQATEVLSH